MTYETKFFINGEYTNGKSEKTFTVKNPATEKPIAEVPIATAADIDAAVAAAKAAQPAWEAQPAMVRANVIRKLGSLISENSETIGELDSVCMGMPKSFSSSMASLATAVCNGVAGQVESVLGTSSLNSPNSVNITLRQPFGVVGAIIPWNGPAALCLFKIAPAIGAGNAIVLKSSEKAPLSSAFIAKLSKEAGVPDGVVNIVSGFGETGELISSHMEIRKISFTGSTRAGRAICQAAARSNLKAVSLELGGKSPMIVFDDANLDAAAKQSAYCVTSNSGQRCVAASRLYVDEKIADKFKEKLIAEYKAVKHVDPASDALDGIGPQVDDIQGKSIMNYLKIGKETATCLLGGNRVGDTGYFIEPTIFTDVTEDNKINKEEIFGPVVILHTFKTEEEVIKRANDTEYGLYSIIFTQNLQRAMRVSRAMESGTVGVNCESMAVDMPFGGYKTSGQGREFGPNWVSSWLEEKSVFFKLD